MRNNLTNSRWPITLYFEFYIRSNIYSGKNHCFMGRNKEKIDQKFFSWE
jgi:hypothetical protein